MAKKIGFFLGVLLFAVPLGVFGHDPRCTENGDVGNILITDSLTIVSAEALANRRAPLVVGPGSRALFSNMSDVPVTCWTRLGRFGDFDVPAFALGPYGSHEYRFVVDGGTVLACLAVDAGAETVVTYQSDGHCN